MDSFSYRTIATVHLFPSLIGISTRVAARMSTSWDYAWGITRLIWNCKYNPFCILIIYTVSMAFPTPSPIVIANISRRYGPRGDRGPAPNWVACSTPPTLCCERPWFRPSNFRYRDSRGWERLLSCRESRRARHRCPCPFHRGPGPFHRCPSLLHYRANTPYQRAGQTPIRENYVVRDPQPPHADHLWWCCYHSPHNSSWSAGDCLVDWSVLERDGHVPPYSTVSLQLWQWLITSYSNIQHLAVRMDRATTSRFVEDAAEQRS